MAATVWWSKKKRSLCSSFSWTAAISNYELATTLQHNQLLQTSKDLLFSKPRYATLQQHVHLWIISQLSQLNVDFSHDGGGCQAVLALIVVA